jgi:hypothetical protein
MEKESENKVNNKVRPQTKHLKPCKPGETANPNGRPLGQRNYATIYREALIKLGQLNNKKPEELELDLVLSGFTNARKGDYRFYKDVLDRVHGTAVQNTDIKSGGEKLETTTDQLAKAKLFEEWLKKQQTQ